MEILGWIAFIIFIGWLFSGSGNKMSCGSCGKKCKQTHIETLKGYNRISEYYRCECCGESWTNDRFFD